MEVHRQRCQKCQSLDLRNILVRAPGKGQVVLVRCAHCKELVARYELSRYYHHGKGFESWLRQIGLVSESARDLAETYETAQDDALREYEAALAQLALEGKDV